MIIGQKKTPVSTDGCPVALLTATIVYHTSHSPAANHTATMMSKASRLMALVSTKAPPHHRELPNGGYMTAADSQTRGSQSQPRAGKGQNARRSDLLCGKCGLTLLKLLALSCFKAIRDAVGVVGRRVQQCPELLHSCCCHSKHITPLRSA